VSRAARIVGYGLAGLVAIALAAFGVLYYRVSNPSDDPQQLPPGLIDAASPEGKTALESSTAKSDHAPLIAAFQRQEKGSWCGVASAVIALRALHIAPSLTQPAFFNDRTAGVRSELAVTFGGMSLDELGALLEAHGARVAVVHAADTDLDGFRAAAAKNLATADDVLLVNYLRAALGQGEMGHISPIGAYDAEGDRFLVLDTAAYKWPATWVAAGALFDAMNTHDSASGKSRG
jgi:hypothetical protein